MSKFTEDEFTLFSPTLVPESDRTTMQEKQAVYKYLSYHYVLKRSFVFIVDDDYDSVFYKQKSSEYVNKFFADMPDTDYFGYISLAKHSTNNEVQLELKGRNTKTKTQFLDAIAEAEFELDIGKVKSA